MNKGGRSARGVPAANPAPPQGWGRGTTAAPARRDGPGRRGREDVPMAGHHRGTGPGRPEVDAAAHGNRDEPARGGEPGGGARWRAALTPVLAALALAAVTALVAAAWPGPWSRAGFGRALALEAAFILTAALNYSGFLWGRRTFWELVTAQPQPPPEELARRDALFLQLILCGATLFALWLVVGAP